MYKKIIFYVFVFTLTAVLNINLRAQNYGKIIPGADAQKMLGSVTFSVLLHNVELQGYLNKTSNILMFNIINGKLYILDNNRKVLTPSNEKVDKEIPFKVYSVSIIKELLNLGKNNVTYIEQRGDIVSLTNGNFTLEFATTCPPICN